MICVMVDVTGGFMGVCGKDVGGWVNKCCLVVRNRLVLNEGCWRGEMVRGGWRGMIFLDGDGVNVGVVSESGIIVVGWGATG